MQILDIPRNPNPEESLVSKAFGSLKNLKDSENIGSIANIHKNFFRDSKISENLTKRIGKTIRKTLENLVPFTPDEILNGLKSSKTPLYNCNLSMKQAQKIQEEDTGYTSRRPDIIEINEKFFSVRDFEKEATRNGWKCKNLKGENHGIALLYPPKNSNLEKELERIEFALEQSVIRYRGKPVHLSRIAAKEKWSLQITKINRNAKGQLQINHRMEEIPKTNINIFENVQKTNKAGMER